VHVLPGLDDGAGNVEQSVEMLRLAAAALPEISMRRRI
jgi:tyrosine-protein phosphatase YwqE